MRKSSVLCAHVARGYRGYGDIKVSLANYLTKEFANASAVCRLFERL